MSRRFYRAAPPGGGDSGAFDRPGGRPGIGATDKAKVGVPVGGGGGGGPGGGGGGGEAGAGNGGGENPRREGHALEGQGAATAEQGDEFFPPHQDDEPARRGRHDLL